MTADQIRKQVDEWHKWASGLSGPEVGNEIQVAQTLFQAEIAAQIAELNQHIADFTKFATDWMNHNWEFGRKE